MRTRALNDLQKQLICGLAIALVALAGCKTAVDEPNYTAAGVGGSLPTGAGGIAPAGGVGGMLPAGVGGMGGTPVGGVGGAPPVGGSAGSTMMPAGAGGMAGGAGAAGSQAGAGGAAGAAGSAGATEMPGPGEVPSAQCLADVMAAGTTVTACEMCLCQVGYCQKELMALKGDTNGNALVKCSQTKKCSGACCVCGAPCDSGGANYGMGMCFNEIEVAAGVAPGSGLLGAGDVMMNCAANGPDMNSCARAVRLGECTAMKCMTECMTPTCM